MSSTFFRHTLSVSEDDRRSVAASPEVAAALRGSVSLRKRIVAFSSSESACRSGCHQLCLDLE